jgi:hypothetical protein
MGSATDGITNSELWGTYLTAPGMPGPAGPISGSPTDGMRIAPYPMPAPAPAAPLHGWWDTPAVAAPPPPPAIVAPPPDPGPGPGPGPGPDPWQPNPIGPGRPVLEQPTVAGNPLGNTIRDAILNPPANYWVGGIDSTRNTKGQGRMKTTQT